MKELINRRDMRSCPAFRKFLELELNHTNSLFFEAKKIGSIGEFNMGVRDFLYLPKYQTAFVALSDMNIISRMDSYFTNVSTVLISLVHSALGKERQEACEVSTY
jgi:hypothetical protein